MSEDLTKKLPHSADEKLILILTNIEALTVRSEQVEHRLEGLEQKVDERLYDTRPIWQKVVSDIQQLQVTVDQTHKGQQAVITDCEEIKMSIRDIYSRFEVLTECIVGAQVRNRDMERRVKALEANSNPPNSQT